MTNHHHLHLYHQPKETGHPGPWLPKNKQSCQKRYKTQGQHPSQRQRQEIYSKMRNGVAAQPTK